MLAFTILHILKNKAYIQSLAKTILTHCELDYVKVLSVLFTVFILSHSLRVKFVQVSSPSLGSSGLCRSLLTLKCRRGLFSLSMTSENLTYDLT